MGSSFDTTSESRDESESTAPGKYRQAIVVVHGMGSQRPLDASLGFIETALEPVKESSGGDPERRYYSMPDNITGSYDSRILVAPRALGYQGPNKPAQEVRAQTDFYEYHWAHLMQGNRLSDLVPTVRRLLLTRWRNVPYGITWLWVACWAVAVTSFGLIVSGHFERLASMLPGDNDEVLLRIGYGIVAIPTAFVVGAAVSLLSRNLASNFVDVTRYLDTSPRSYAVRREIRQGFVKLLKELHEDADGDIDNGGQYRYRRIIVVAHSLGALIAYDGISSLWGQAPRPVAGCSGPQAQREWRGAGTDSGPQRSRCGGCAVCELERRADQLRQHSPGGPIEGCDYRSRRKWTWERPDEDRSALDDPKKGAPTRSHPRVREYQEAQRRLWHELAALDRTWRISDFITVGTPMYFADRLVHQRNGSRFVDRVARRELSVCPPVNDNVLPPKSKNRRWLSALVFWRERDTTLPHDEAEFAYEINGKRFLHQGAVFSVVRWSNCYFPARLAAFGDVFGGPVSMLFGRGINDLAIRGNRWTWKLRPSRYVPALSHGWYYRFADDDKEGSVARTIRDFLSLKSEPWVNAGVSPDDGASASSGDVPSDPGIPGAGDRTA